MARPPPGYSLHIPSGQARVRLNGKTIYLGVFDSPESHDRYDGLIAKWYAGRLDTDTMTIARLAIMYVEHARYYYRKDGVETSEVHSITFGND